MKMDLKKEFRNNDIGPDILFRTCVSWMGNI